MLNSFRFRTFWIRQERFIETSPQKIGYTRTTLTAHPLSILESGAMVIPVCVVPMVSAQTTHLPGAAVRHMPRKAFNKLKP